MTWNCPNHHGSLDLWYDSMLLCKLPKNLHSLTSRIATVRLQRQVRQGYYKNLSTVSMRSSSCFLIWSQDYRTNIVFIFEQYFFLGQSLERLIDLSGADVIDDVQINNNKNNKLHDIISVRNILAEDPSHPLFNRFKTPSRRPRQFYPAKTRAVKRMKRFFSFCMSLFNKCQNHLPPHGSRLETWSTRNAHCPAKAHMQSASPRARPDPGPISTPPSVLHTRLRYLVEVGKMV